MSNKTTDDTESTTTKAEPATAVHASRDNPDQFNEDGTSKLIHQEGTEDIKEKVKLDDPPKEEEELNPREAIARKHDERRRAEEMGGEENPKKTETVTNSVSETVPGSEPVDKRNGNDTILDKDKLVPVKVFGREILVEQSRIDKAGGIAAYQKEVAVNQGFKDNAQRKAELDEREEKIKQRESLIAQQERQLPTLDADAGTKQVKSDPPPKGDQSELAELIKQHRQALLSGDDEKADELMLQIAGQNKSQPIDEEKIAERAAQSAKEKISREQQEQADRDAADELSEAKGKFLKDHPELKTDARLFDMVDIETERVEQEFPDMKPLDVMEAAFKRVSEWRGPKNQEKDSMDSKLDEKRSTAHPKAGTRRAEAPPPKPRQQTNSDYIQSLKTNRGQV